MAVVCDIEKWKQKKRNMIKQAGGLILLYIIWQNKNENENIHLVGQKILKSSAQKKKKKKVIRSQSREIGPTIFFLIFICIH